MRFGECNKIDQQWEGSNWVQCWFVVNQISKKNLLKWSFDKNTNMFIEENMFENIVCKMAVILTRPQWDFSCDQAALRTLSVCPSHLFDNVPLIVSSWNF